MNIKKINFLQIGLGSMGRRRIRCLLYNGIRAAQIFGFDLNSKRCRQVGSEYKIKTFNSFTQAVKQIKPQVFIISTPPNHHDKYFLYAAKNKIHFFEDTSALDKGYKKLMPLLDGTFVAAPGCAFRFLPAIKEIKKILRSGAIGKVLAFNHYNGQYLPDWHPWEDYRKTYLAQKRIGGPQQAFNFELSWLIDILNSPVKKLVAIADRVSDLEISNDDVMAVSVQLKNGVIGSIMMDCLSRQPYRSLRLIGSRGNIEWDFQKYEINLYQTKGKNSKSGTAIKKKTINLKKGEIAKGYTTSTEEMYRQEMMLFLDAIAGKKTFPYTYQESHQNLKALFALQKSSRTGKAISIMALK